MSATDGGQAVCTVMGMGTKAICAGMDGDRDRVQRGRLGMDSKFARTDGDGDKLSFPRSCLLQSTLHLM